mgnify:CR=1 FL=1
MVLFKRSLENLQDFSSKQVSFLLNSLVDSRYDTAYNFYIKNKLKFEKNYGDSLLVLESYLEETSFLQESDTIIKNATDQEKLTQQEIEEFERNKFGEKILENLISEYKS